MLMLCSADILLTLRTVLPTGLKERLVKDLDKRLDLDIDNIIESPKLRLQLSPAELDKRLLELYKDIQKGPRGDVLRIIGGGQEVALQDLYIKTHAIRERARNPLNQTLTFGPFESLGEESDDGKRTASQWVNLALRRNLAKSYVSTTRLNAKQDIAKEDTEGKNDRMTMSLQDSARSYPRTALHATKANQFCPPRSTRSFSLLI